MQEEIRRLAAFLRLREHSVGLGEERYDHR
jgi:hypothetical protein